MQINKIKNMNVELLLPPASDNLRPKSTKSLVYNNLDNLDKKSKKKIEILTKIKDNFEDPSKYLELDENLIVGKKITGPKFDLCGKVIPRTVVGDPNVIERRNNCHINPTNQHRQTAISARPTTGRLNGQKVLTTNYDIVETDELDQIFNKAKDRCIKSREKVKEDIENNKEIGPFTKDCFFKQEKCLEANKRRKLESARISRAISSKIKRDNEDLLMNRTDAFRMKKQIKELIDSKRPIEEKYGDNCWIMSLRREKNPTRIRTAYINIGSDRSEIWKPIIEFPPKKVELIQRPNTHSHRDMKYMINNKYFNNHISKLNINIDNINVIKRLEIEGKSLLDEEMKLIKESKGKKTIYKDPSINIPENVNNQVLKQFYDDKILIKSKKF